MFIRNRGHAMMLVVLLGLLQTGAEQSALACLAGSPTGRSSGPAQSISSYPFVTAKLPSAGKFARSSRFRLINVPADPGQADRQRRMNGVRPPG
jgi:hypothetical protein